jgi:hypothetical protein
VKLIDKVRSYYKALQYEGSYEHRKDFPNLVVARRESATGGKDTQVIWVQDQTPDKVDAKWETKILGDLGKVAEKQRGSFTFLIYNRENLSQEFLRLVKNLNFNVQVESNFFDATFKSELPLQTGTMDACREILVAADEERRHRIKQPYEILDQAMAVKERKDDISKDLAGLFAKGSEKPRVVLLLGPAGAGKTSAFNAVFQKTFEAFKERRQKREEACRPLPLIPSHIRRGSGVLFQDVINSFLETDMARPIRAEAFNWLVDQGFASLFIDGLDEILASDSTIFNSFFLERLTNQNSRARILLCVRDSLINTCNDLRTFIEDAGGMIEILRLAPWGRKEREEYKGRFQDGQLRDRFTQLTSDKKIDSVASNAFCCKQIGDLLEAGGNLKIENTSGLYQTLLEGYVEREFGKNLFAGLKINRESVIDYLESLGESFYKNEGKPVLLSEMRDLAALLASTPEEEEGAILTLTKLPLFRYAESKDSVNFIHESWGSYLFSNRIAKSLGAPVGEQIFANYLNTADFGKSSLLLKMAAENIDPRKIRSFCENKMELLNEQGFRNFLRILFASPAVTEVDLKKIDFERKPLEGLEFRGLNLEGVVFDGSDLAGAIFEKCNLSGSSFMGVVFENTVISECELKKSRIGNLDYFSSLRLGGHFFQDSIGAVHRWKIQSGEVKAETKAPKSDPNEIQIKRLFSKFVYPNGQYIRDDLDYGGFCSGMRIPGARPIKEIVDLLVKRGYLIEKNRPRHRIQRPDGEKLNEMTQFVTKNRISEGIKEIIQTLGE